ncbi:MAG: HAMP domain-containing protein [Anaerolineae bacterium]|nr:HAMP domain-containing protein [Anaerolineae bacterium]
MAFLNNIKMRTKLIALFLLVGVVPLAVATGIGIWRSGDALQEQALAKLETVEKMKKQQIETYFSERRGDMIVLTNIVRALMQEGYSSLEAVQVNKSLRLEDYFGRIRSELLALKDDPYALQAMQDFNRVFEDNGDKVDTPEWRALAARYDQRFRDIATDNGWRDLFLIHSDGDIVYTLLRQSDLGMVIPDSELRDSGLGQVYQKGQTLSAEDIAVADFAPYAPSGGPAAFMLAQMRDVTGTLQGYVAFQIPIDPINAIVQERTGLGQTGETYLMGKVGDAITYRSDRVVKTGKLGEEKGGGASDYNLEALAGRSGLAANIGSTGDLEMTAYRPLNLPGLNWAIFTTEALQEVAVPTIQGQDKDLLTKYVEEYGYYDLFLVDPNGQIFYTVMKEADYNTNILTGKYGNSNLSGLVQQVLETKTFAMADFEAYEPSDNKPMAFIAQPILDESGVVNLVVALQLPYEHINKIMQESTGMGESGESYLVGRINGVTSFRSDLVKIGGGQYTIGTETPDLDYVDAAFDSFNKTTAVGSDGTVILVAYEPLAIDGLTWAVICRVDQDEIREPANALAFLLGGIALVVAFVVALVGIFFAASLAGPIQIITAGAQRLAKGDAALAGMDWRKIEAINVRRDELGDIGKAFAALIGYFKSGANAMQSIAAGDLSVEVAPQDPADLMGNAMVAMKQNIAMMAADVTHLIEAAIAGRLDTRADADKFTGEYYTIVQGVNDTLDAVIGPLNVAAEYVDRISKGDIPAKITDTYNGDFNEIKINLNMCIDALNGLIAETNMLTQAAVEGRLDKRGDTTHFHGAYAVLVRGVNATLDAVIGPLNVAAEYVDRISKGDIPAKITDNYNGDFNEIKNNLNQCIDAVNTLVADVNMLSAAAVAGKLATRADASRHQGDFRKIVQGVNDTLNSVIGPLNVAADYVDQIARGEIPQPITDTYQGDFDVLKRNLNTLSASLREMLGNIQEAASNLSAASAEILAATTQQASGSSEQSAAITQATTTVDEVRTISEQAVMRAQEVADASQRTVDVSRNGRRSVDETITSMGHIKERVERIAENILALSDQTQQIGEIIATVNDIASQSNMLALNASVEAARAGEHGKGFAVVAMEVRNLAEQSKQATAQVRAILTDIQNAINASVMVTEEGSTVVDEGVTRAAQAREAIEQLASVIMESAQIATQVVAGGQQQSSGVEQIAMAMQNINQAMVQSLASTRQAEKSARDLNDLAGAMNDTVRQYKFNGNGRK